MIGNFLNRFFNLIGINSPEQSNPSRKRSIEKNDIIICSPPKRPRIESSSFPSRMASRENLPESSFKNTGTIRKSLNTKRHFNPSLTNNDISILLPPANDFTLPRSNSSYIKHTVPLITIPDQENNVEAINKPKHIQSFIRNKMPSKPYSFEINEHFTKKVSIKRTSPLDSTLMVTFDLDEKQRYNKLLSSYLPSNSSRPFQERFSQPKICSSPIQKLNKTSKFEIIDLEKNDDVLPLKINVNPPTGTSNHPIILDEEQSPLTQKLCKMKTLNSFEEKLKKTQYLNDWIINFEKKCLDKRKEKEQLIKNELERTEILKKHNHKAIIFELEQRLKRSFLLSQIEKISIDDQELVLPELTAQMKEEIKKALVLDPPNEVIINKYNVTVIRRELNTLSGLNWLNDAVINFYMELIMERCKKSDFPKSYCFNTFFYTRLVKAGYSGVKRWTRKIDLFSYDLICIPIHLGVHWCMAIVDFRKRFIGFYDSMGSNNDTCLNHIRTYLKEERLDKKKEKFDLSEWKFENVKDIPQQMNGSDCGVFSCMFAEFISRDAPLNFSQAEMPYFRNKMVYEIIYAKLLE